MSGKFEKKLVQGYRGDNGLYMHAQIGTGVNLFMNFVLHTLSQPTFYSNLCKREKERERINKFACAWSACVLN